jgi:hypothetical protein
MRNQRNYFLRTTEERKWIESNTWCNICDKADIGMNEVVEIEEDGEIFVEGKCLLCGQTVHSTIEEQNK